jgi:hypothetical protein
MKHFYSLLAAVFCTIALNAAPPGWTYTVPYTITNNTATAAYGYQARLTFDSQTPIGLGQMNAAGNDIRFGKNCAGTTLFNYWIESGINTTTTVAWVKIDTLPANGTVTFYMYYGNSSAPAVSAVPGVFIGPHSSTDSVASGGAGGVGNSQRGFRFTPNETVLVTAFGKREPTGTTRYVTLFDFTTQAILQQTQVSGPAAQYSYQNIANPMWLNQGTQYVLELFQGAGDGYYYGTSSQIGQHFTYGDMRYCNSCTQNTFPTNTLSNYHYGYPDMWYWTKTNLSSAPTITLGSSATISAVGSLPASVCFGDSVSISMNVSGGTGPYLYSWAPSASVGSPNAGTTMVSPAANETYTCNVVDQCGATGFATVPVVVNALPSVGATVTSTAVCSGSSFTANGNGAATYTWTGGVTDGVPFTPSTNDTYIVTGTDANGCTDTAAVSVNVLSLPNVVGNVTSSTICAGSTVTFTGSGATSYTWDNGVTDGVPYTPAASGSFIVSGSDANGCVNADTVNVTVNALPAVAAQSNPAAICSGNSAVITASGASSYLWTSLSSTNSSETVSPSSSTTYTVIGLDSLTGCSDSTSVTVNVNDNPTVAVAGDSICANGCSQYNAIVTGGNPSYTYSWSPATGLSSTTVANPSVCLNSTTCHTITVTDTNGCVGSMTACVFVNPAPVVALTGPSSVCVTDGSYTLTASPSGGTFSGPGVTGNSFSPSAAGNGTHQIVYTFTDANGCDGADTINIDVTPCVGINENGALSGVEVYPNPFNEMIVINITEGTSQIRIMNALGAVIYDQKMNSGRNEISTSEFASGVYFVEVMNANGTATVKLVKNN